MATTTTKGGGEKKDTVFIYLFICVFKMLINGNAISIYMWERERERETFYNFIITIIIIVNVLYIYIYIYIYISGSMFNSLLEEVPKEWANQLRPFLQSAEEFEELQQVVSYFLRTHVAFILMRLRKTGDSIGTSFLSKLLEALEKEKNRLGPQLNGVDGRTVLTKVALQLFAKADEAERSGCGANMNIVRLFFTSSVLFEATGQFMKDGEIDPIAEQRRNYARFIAVRMKKSLSSGTPYISPNIAKISEEKDRQESYCADEDKLFESGQNKQDLFFLESQERQEKTKGSSPPPLQEPLSSSDCLGYHHPAAHTMSDNIVIGDGGSINDSYSGGTGGGPSMEAMLNAQKFAKNAVSALQFYDYVTAQKELLRAMELLK